MTAKLKNNDTSLPEKERKKNHKHTEPQRRKKNKGDLEKYINTWGCWGVCAIPGLG